MVQIAIMGYGVVGSGVVEVLNKHKESLKSRAKEEINIKYILDIRDFPGDEMEYAFTKSFDDIINDEEVKIVVEVMGGTNPAYDYVKRCLLAGKSVVTSNKELVATKGAELIQIAKDKNLNFLFEASVGGGIPIIRPISQCLVANDVKEIAGILNGTTNFILTKMIKEQMDFDKALSLAQKKGYAERNPAADVEGTDACRKICILASLTFGKHIYPDCVLTEGIRKIKMQDVEYASTWGGVIKLIGKVKCLPNGKMDVVVAPMFVKNKSPLANVDDVFNGIMVRGDSTGDVVFYGKGAGKKPTASAVVADIVDCIKHINARKYLYWTDSSNEDVISPDDSVNAMYVRCRFHDELTAMDMARALFGDVKRIFRSNEHIHEFAFITPEIRYGDFIGKISEFEKCGYTVLSKLRVADF